MHFDGVFSFLLSFYHFFYFSCCCLSHRILHDIFAFAVLGFARFIFCWDRVQCTRLFWCSLKFDYESFTFVQLIHIHFVVHIASTFFSPFFFHFRAEQRDQIEITNRTGNENVKKFQIDNDWLL